MRQEEQKPHVRNQSTVSFVSVKLSEHDNNNPWENNAGLFLPEQMSLHSHVQQPEASAHPHSRLQSPMVPPNTEFGDRHIIPRPPRRRFPMRYDSALSTTTTTTTDDDDDEDDNDYDGGGGRGSRGRGRNRGGCDIYQNGLSTMVELQIEGLSPFVSQLMLYMWYMVLIAAIVVEAIVFLSWGLVDICGESVNDMYHYDDWSSSCATVVAESTTSALYTVRWEGGPYKVNLRDQLVPFKSVVFSLKSPDNWAEGDGNVLEFFLQAHLHGYAEGDRNATLPLNIICWRSMPRCEFAVLPADAVLNEVGGGKWALTLFDLPERLRDGANSSSIGIVYQKPGYALGVLIWRYVFMVLSALHLMRFIVYQKFTNMLYEQGWVVVLQLLLLWYLNPIAAVNTASHRHSLVLHFLEFHFPSWFMAVFVGFMFSLITASMPWTVPSPPSGEREPVTRNLSGLEKLKKILCRSRSIYDPPLWTKIIVLIFVLVIFGLEIADIVLENMTVSPAGSAWPTPIYRSMVIIFLFGGFICCGLLIHLHRNLGRKSYLDSRPQQLACRLFILIFVTGGLFYTYLLIMFFACYLRIPGMASRQPLNQLPALMVSTLLVNIMTLTYTTRNRSRLVPIHPRDERWKYMIWPNTWYRWLYRHGGSMYIFHSEMEEATFNWNQFEFRMRQYMAKSKLKRYGVHSRGSRPVPSGPQNASHEQHVEKNDQNDDAAPVQRANHARMSGSPSSFWHGFLSATSPRGTNKVLNMDMTSTWFLPRQCSRIRWGSARQSPCTTSPSFGMPTDDTTSLHMGPSFDTHQSSPVLTYQPQRCAYPQMSLQSPERSPPQRHIADIRDISTVNRQVPEETPLRSSNRRGSDVEMMERDDDGVSDGTLRWMRTLCRAQEGLGFIVRMAERNLISRPIHAFEHMETFLLDTVQRPFQGVGYLPFFNLETAIDCINLSWEAYGTMERDNARVERRKRRVLHCCCSSCCCCCCSSSPSSSRSRSPSPSPSRLDREPFAGITTLQVEGPLGGGEDGNTRRGDAHDSEGRPDRWATVEDAGLPPPINVERYGYRLCAVWEAMDVQVIISELDMEKEEHKKKVPRIVIAFRGTTNMSNAWQDMRVRRVVWDEMVEGEKRPFRGVCCRRQPTVHVGFLSIWNAHREYVHEKVWEKLVAHPEIVYRVFCTGHSLGGALATLCAYSVRRMLRHAKYPLTDVTVYTFGQPPLGNEAFQSAYNKAIPRTFRVVNESDAVALINMYGYHVGIEVDIDRHGNYICQPTYIERLFRPMKGKGFAIENHLLSSYSASLGAVARDTTCPVLPLLEFGDNPEQKPHGGNANGVGDVDNGDAKINSPVRGGGKLESREETLTNSKKEKAGE